MAKTGVKTKRQIHWGAVIILLAGAVTFGLAVWTRLYLSRPTALEALIAENAPAESVQTLFRAPNGDLLVGTTVGVIRGNGKRWERLPNFAGDVKAIFTSGSDGLLLAGHGTGLTWYTGTAERSYLSSIVDGLARGGGRLIVLLDGRELQWAPGPDQEWTLLARFDGGERMLSLAAAGERIAVGGVQGSLFESLDGGKTWETRQSPGGSVTALLYDLSKEGRLWVAAGGGAFFSDDGGNTWRRPAKRSANQPVISLATAPGGVVGVSPEGLLITIGE